MTLSSLAHRLQLTTVEANGHWGERDLGQLRLPSTLLDLVGAQVSIREGPEWQNTLSSQPLAGRPFSVMPLPQKQAVGPAFVRQAAVHTGRMSDGCYWTSRCQPTFGSCARGLSPEMLQIGSGCKETEGDKHHQVFSQAACNNKRFNKWNVIQLGFTSLTLLLCKRNDYMELGTTKLGLLCRC